MDFGFRPFPLWNSSLNSHRFPESRQKWNSSLLFEGERKEERNTIDPALEVQLRPGNYKVFVKSPGFTKLMRMKAAGLHSPLSFVSSGEELNMKFGGLGLTRRLLESLRNSRQRRMHA